MIDDVLNNGLGSSSRAGSYGGNRSYSQQSTTTATSRSSATPSVEFDRSTDPYANFILTGNFVNQSSRSGSTSTNAVIVTDGEHRESVAVGTKQYVADAIEKWLQSHYMYAFFADVMPTQTILERYGVRQLSNAVQTPIGTLKKTDLEELQKVSYSTALANNVLIVANDILKNADSANRVFYIPKGYYYVGSNAENAPKINTAAADNALTTTAATAGDDDTMLYLFLAALGVIAVGVVMKRKNKKKR